MYSRTACQLPWANHTELTAHKTTFTQQLEKFYIMPPQSVSSPEDDFFNDISKEQSHGTIAQKIDDYLSKQGTIRQLSIVILE